MGAVDIVLDNPARGAGEVVLVAAQQALTVPTAAGTSLPGEAIIDGLEGDTEHEETETRVSGGGHP